MSKSSISQRTFAANTISTDEFAGVSKNANDSTGKRPLRAFLNHINKFGVQVQNNFEVEFEGLEGLTLFVQSFELPGSKQNTCEIFYDGIKLTLPVNYESEHEFSMTIINDAQGFIYSAIKSYIEYDAFNHYSSSQKRMVIKALTGQINSTPVLRKHETYLKGDMSLDVAYQGSYIIAYGVRFNSISGLTYGQSNNEIQTFTVQGTLIEYSHLPLSLADKKNSRNI